MGPWDHVLDGVQIPPWERANFGVRMDVPFCRVLCKWLKSGQTGMPGHVRQNDTDFTLLQEELNAPIFRPLRPNFAIGPL